MEQLRVEVQKLEIERKAEKKANEALNKAWEEEKGEEEEEKEKKPHNEGAEHGLPLFHWDKNEHRLYLSACLSTFPQELVNLVGSLVPVLEWSEAQKSADIGLPSDDSGLRRVARHNDDSVECRSVLSHQPLSPSPVCAASSPSSSSSPKRSSVAAFEVRMDHLQGIMYVGVSCVLPPDERAVGDPGLGVSYCSEGGVFIQGDDARPLLMRCGEEISLPSYTEGDLIRVEVDFSVHTVTFFKNGVMQGRPLDISDFSKSGMDLAQPLYAAVSMLYSGDQVTLL